MQRRSLNFAALLICSARELIPITYICGIIRYFHPHVNHNAHLNYSLNYILFMSVFPPCHWKKLEEAELSDRQRCTAPRKASEAFIFNTRAGRLRVSGVYASLKHTHTHIHTVSHYSFTFSKRSSGIFICKMLQCDVWEDLSSNSCLCFWYKRNRLIHDAQKHKHFVVSPFRRKTQAL